MVVVRVAVHIESCLIRTVSCIKSDDSGVLPEMADKSRLFLAGMKSDSFMAEKGSINPTNCVEPAEPIQSSLVLSVEL